jgi:hypothetical protein
MEKWEKCVETFENIGKFCTPPAHLIEICCRPQRHEENLIADYADDSDLIGHEKAQKAPRNLDADCAEKYSHKKAQKTQRKINHE